MLQLHTVQVQQPDLFMMRGNTGVKLIVSGAFSSGCFCRRGNNWMIILI